MNRSLVVETLLWVAVIMATLLAEVGMHEFGGFSPAGGTAVAAVMVTVAATAFARYWQNHQPRWLFVSLLVAFLGGSILADGFRLEPLPNFSLKGLLPAGVGGPTRGLLAITHLLADFSVVVIGLYQIVRWFRLRRTGIGLSGVAALTACCRTTGAVLGPFLAAILGALGIHSGVSSIIVAAVLTAALAAVAYAWSGPDIRLFLRRPTIAK